MELKAARQAFDVHNRYLQMYPPLLDTDVGGWEDGDLIGSDGEPGKKVGRMGRKNTESESTLLTRL